MASNDGSITIRAGSQDYITWQLQTEDGVPIDLSAATSAVLKMLHRKDKSTKTFSTLDNPQKFYITDAVNGKVQLRPAADDFSVSAAYIFYVDFVDSIGVHSVPEHENYILKVIDKIN